MHRLDLPLQVELDRTIIVRLSGGGDPIVQPPLTAMHADYGAIRRSD
jgi:hypothetical protein